jgi:hypothetical protein
MLGMVYIRYSVLGTCHGHVQATVWKQCLQWRGLPRVICTGRCTEQHQQAHGSACSKSIACGRQRSCSHALTCRHCSTIPPHGWPCDALHRPPHSLPMSASQALFSLKLSL